MPTNDVEAHNKVAYSRSVTMGLQQKRTRLRQLVEEEEFSGELFAFDEDLPTEAQTRLNDTADLEPVTVDKARRMIRATEAVWSTYVGDGQKIREIRDPTSSYTQLAISAMNRRIDRTIIDAIFGNVIAGKNGTEIKSFAAGQILANAGTGLTLAKLIKAKEIIDAAENDEEEDRFIIVTSRQVSDLLKTTEVTNADYANVKALSDGKINSFMGFNFVRSQMLPLASPDVRRCPVVLRSGVRIGLPRDVTSAVDWIPQKQSWLISSRMWMAAGRTNEQKVVDIQCHEVP